MFQKSSGLRFHELSNHIAEDRTHSIETLIRSADVIETIVVKQNLLHDENSNRFAKLRACLHDPQAKGNNLGRQEEVNNFARVVLYESPNDTETGKTQVFEGAGFGGRV